MPWNIEHAILVPYDFSEHSHSAVEKAIQLAGNPSQVHILHVLHTILALAPGGFPLEAVDDGRASRTRKNSWLENSKTLATLV